MAVELHCPVQINSSLRHYGRSTDLAELRGREDARDKREMQGEEEEVNGQIRWAEGGVSVMEVHEDDAECLDTREVVPFA